MNYERFLKDLRVPKRYRAGLAERLEVDAEMSSFANNLTWSLAWLSYQLRETFEGSTGSIVGAGELDLAEAEQTAWRAIKADFVKAAEAAGAAASPFILSGEAQPGLRGPDHPYDYWPRTFRLEPEFVHTSRPRAVRRALGLEKTTDWDRRYSRELEPFE